MKIIFTYKRLTGTSRTNHSCEFNLNHGYDETIDKAVCGFDYKQSLNVIGKPEEEIDYNRMITCKKCRNKLGLDNS